MKTSNTLVVISGFLFVGFGATMLLITFNPENTGMPELWAAVFLGGLGTISFATSKLFQWRAERKTKMRRF